MERDKGIFMLIMGRDYQYRDCDVERYIWNEDNGELTIFCNYHGRENIKISMRNTKKCEALEILPVHTIDYVVRTYDKEKQLDCWEFRLQHLCEVAKIWAEGMVRM